MLDVFFIFILVIVVGLLSGLIYLIYLPFKKRLLKSDKLNGRLNRRINSIFILVPCLILFILYCFKDYRTSSKDRLEKISAVHLPTKFKVLKDEYQDMLQDYCVLYNIQFGNKENLQIIRNIRSSKFYNSNSFHKGVWRENDFIIGDSSKAEWSKSSKGYDFRKQVRGTSYHINLDTSSNVLKYEECGY